MFLLSPYPLWASDFLKEEKDPVKNPVVLLPTLKSDESAHEVNQFQDPIVVQNRNTLFHEIDILYIRYKADWERITTALNKKKKSPYL
jgi:hypothetical protein